MHNKNYISLLIWILVLIVTGAAIGSLTKPEVAHWYKTLHKSPLTPPDYIFPIAWTILYALIGICGWLIWHAVPSSKLKLIKTLYIVQLILNWSWSPLFFNYHLLTTSFIVISAIDILVSTIILLAYDTIKSVSLFMIPYLLWLLLASYLNWYIWWYN